MKPKDSQYWEDWRRIAEKDFGRAHFLLQAEDVEAAGFYLQQALEKFLKAFLLKKGWRLRRIHDLESLLNDAIFYDNSFESFRAVTQKVTAFYFIERYPLMSPASIDLEDVRNGLADANPMIQKIRKHLDDRN